MQPARTGGENSSSDAVKKWGPVGVIVVVAAVIVGLVVMLGGDDGNGDGGNGDGAAGPETTVEGAASDTADADGATTATNPPATDQPATDQTATDQPGSGQDGSTDITYPLSFDDAAEAGIDVAWDERCDTDRGRLAVKWYFAPPCYAPFDGDNGGATATGVTADSITVVQYFGPDDDPIINYVSDAVASDDDNADEEATARNMLALFENYYELYGRTIELEVYVSSGLANDEVTARADAVRIAEDIAPFAVLGGPALTNAFADELAARGVVCIGCTPTQPAQWYADRDPYVFGLGISNYQAREHGREFISKQLVGSDAEYAGDETFRTSQRVFGHVYLTSSPESPTIAETFVDGLRSDGADVAEVLTYTLDPATIQSQASQIIAKLKASAVTTVVLTSDGVAPRDLTREATAQDYFPEWVIVAPSLADLTAFGRTYDQQQWANAFGLTHNVGAPVTPENTGFYALHVWLTGAPPPADDTIALLMPNYTFLASGIQATGPDLTPDTFRDAQFDGPATIPGITAPFLSYGNRGYWADTDYTGVDDAALIWWDPTAEGPDEIRRSGTGMYVFVDGGTRYLPGEWPSESALFDPAGGITVYDTPPANETPPNYPSPAG